MRWGGPACSAHLLLTSLVQQGERAGGPWGILKAWSQLGFKGAGAPKGRLLAGGPLLGSRWREGSIVPIAFPLPGHGMGDTEPGGGGTKSRGGGTHGHGDPDPSRTTQAGGTCAVPVTVPVAGRRDFGFGGGDTAWGPPAVAQGHRGQLRGWQGVCAGGTPTSWWRGDSAELPAPLLWAGGDESGLPGGRGGTSWGTGWGPDGGLASPAPLPGVVTAGPRVGPSRAPSRAVPAHAAPSRTVPKPRSSRRAKPRRADPERAKLCQTVPSRASAPCATGQG